MRLLAALSAGALVYLRVGMLVGIRPVIGADRERGRPMRSRHAAEWLGQTGADVTVGQMLGLGSVVAGAGLVAMTALTGVASLGLLLGAGGFALPWVVLSRRRAQLLGRKREAWPDALRDLLTHLRSGVSVHGGLLLLASSGPDPLRSTFVRYQQLSAALERRTALEVIREELADPLSDRVIDVIGVAIDQGASVVIEVLEHLVESASDDLRLLADSETAQLETRLEARGAALLPFVVLALLCATSEDYRVFYRTPMGWLVVGVGGCFALVGLVAIARLGRVPMEGRIAATGGWQ